MLNELISDSQLEEIQQGVAAYIYKHSTQCPVSSLARKQVERFQQKHPEVQVYRLDVVEHRSLSDRVATNWGVRHESPQVLIVKGPQLLWSGSHFQVTLRKLEQQRSLLD